MQSDACKALLLASRAAATPWSLRSERLLVLSANPRALRTHILRLLGPKTILYN